MAGGDSEAPAPLASFAFWNYRSYVDGCSLLLAAEGPPATGAAGDAAPWPEGVKEAPLVHGNCKRCRGNIPSASARLTCAEQSFVSSQRIGAFLTTLDCTVSIGGAADVTTSALPIKRDVKERNSRMNASLAKTSGRAAVAATIKGRALSLRKAAGFCKIVGNKGAVTVRAAPCVSQIRGIDNIPDSCIPPSPQNSSTHYLPERPVSVSDLVTTPNRPVISSSRYPVASRGSASFHVPECNALIQTSIAAVQANEGGEPNKQRRLQGPRSPGAQTPLQPPRQAQPRGLCKHRLKIDRGHTTSVAFSERSLHKFRVWTRLRHLVRASVVHRAKRKDSRKENQLKQGQNVDCTPRNIASDTNNSEQTSIRYNSVSGNTPYPLLRYGGQTRHRPLALLSFLVQASVFFFCGIFCASSSNTENPEPSAWHNERCQASSSKKNHFSSDYSSPGASLPHQKIPVTAQLISEPADTLWLRTAHRTPGRAAALGYKFHHSHQQISQAEAATQQRKPDEASDKNLEDEAAAGVAEPTQLNSDTIYKTAFHAVGTKNPSGSTQADNGVVKGGKTKLGRQRQLFPNVQPFGMWLPSRHCSGNIGNAAVCASSKAARRSPAPLALINGLGAREFAEAAERHRLRSWRPPTPHGITDGFIPEVFLSPSKTSGLVSCRTTAATKGCDLRRLSLEKGNRIGRSSASVRKDSADFLQKKHSIKIQSLVEEMEKNDQHQRRGHRTLEVQRQQGVGHCVEEHELKKSLESDKISELTRLRLSGTGYPILQEQPNRTTSSRTPLTSKNVQMVGGTFVRRLHASQEGDNPEGKQHSGALDADGVLGEAAESVVAEEQVKVISPVSAVARKTAPSASFQGHTSTRSKAKVSSAHDEKNGSPLSKPRRREESLPKEERRQLLGSDLTQAVPKTTYPLEESKEELTMTKQRQQVPKEENVAEKRRVSSIAALRELLAELSVTSRRRRDKAAKKRHVSDGEKAGAVALSRHASTSQYPLGSTTSPPLTSTSGAGLAYPMRGPTRAPWTTVEATDSSEPPTNLAAAPQTKSAREIGDESMEVESACTKAAACTREGETSGEQLWYICAEESEDSPEYTDGDDNTEEEQPELIQQQEEEATRRAKLRHHPSLGPAISTNLTGVHAASQVSHITASKGFTPAKTVKGTVAESVEINVMKKMWETRGQLSDLAKKKLSKRNLRYECHRPSASPISHT